MELEQARNAKQRLQAELSDRSAELRSRVHAEAVTPGEVAAVRPVAFGIACRQPGQDYVIAVRIQAEDEVEDDRPLFEGAAEVAGEEVDIQYTGLVRAQQWNRQRQRPLLIGASTGHFAISAGTIGAFVRQNGEAETLMLSNNHVLANENAAGLGDAILQPGPADGGQDPRDRVARLADAVDIDFGAGGLNIVDCAVGELESGTDFDAQTLTGLGGLVGLRTDRATLFEDVAKIGRTTGLTRGAVTAIELDNVAVQYDSGVAVFNDQFEVQSPVGSFSRGGDSGSLIVDAGLQGIGLLFAGNNRVTYANYIDNVMAGLGIELVLDAPAV